MSNGPDPLTAFFVVSALVLTTMWWLEQSGSEELADANVAAGEFSRDHLGPNCDAFAAEQGGRTLVVVCERGELSGLERKASAAPARFGDVVLVAGSNAVRCSGGAQDCSPVELAATTERDAAEPRPSPEFAR
jgi:hypothetical protein